MYYVNEEQIGKRLSFIPVITDALRSLVRLDGPGLTDFFAQERALHLAIEVVTDVGSLLIDGFLMRDASSYEDIVEILRTEGVLPQQEADQYLALVGLRRMLTQEYMDIDRTALREDLEATADLMDRFAPLVEAFVRKELQGQGL